MGSLITNDEALQKLIDAAAFYAMMQVSAGDVEKADKIIDKFENVAAELRKVVPDLPNPD